MSAFRRDLERRSLWGNAATIARFTRSHSLHHTIAIGWLVWIAFSRLYIYVDLPWPTTIRIYVHIFFVAQPYAGYHFKIMPQSWFMIVVLAESCHIVAYHLTFIVCDFFDITDSTMSCHLKNISYHTLPTSLCSTTSLLFAFSSCHTPLVLWVPWVPVIWIPITFPQYTKGWDSQQGGFPKQTIWIQSTTKQNLLVDSFLLEFPVPGAKVLDICSLLSWWLVSPGRVSPMIPAKFKNWPPKKGCHWNICHGHGGNDDHLAWCFLRKEDAPEAVGILGSNKHLSFADQCCKSIRRTPWPLLFVQHLTHHWTLLRKWWPCHRFVFRKHTKYTDAVNLETRLREDVQWDQTEMARTRCWSNWCRAVQYILVLQSN